MPLRPRQSARAQRAAFWRHWVLWIYFPLAVLLVAGGMFLWRSGHWLVVEDPFERVPWAAVLAGEYRTTERADAAYRLYLDGRIDSLIYSGTPIFKTRHASEMLVDYLAKQGYPREKLFEFRNEAYSTLEEARLLIRQFRQQGLDTVVVITVNFHTARARRIFRKLSQGYPHVLVYPAEHALFEPSSWWSSREGRKYWLLEWTKTAATWFELMASSPETGKAGSNGLIGAMEIAPENRSGLPEYPAVKATPDPMRGADSAAEVRRDSADTAKAGPADSSGAAGIDTADAAVGAERDQADAGPPAAARPEAAAPAIPEGTPRKEAAKGSSKDTVPPKAPAKASGKAPVRKAPEKEKEKAKKKPSR